MQLLLKCYAALQDNLPLVVMYIVAKKREERELCICGYGVLLNQTRFVTSGLGVPIFYRQNGFFRFYENHTREREREKKKRVNGFY